ncbi:hypothetical protein HPP92_005402, partial [Vanilla planifolia]
LHESIKPILALDEDTPPYLKKDSNLDEPDFSQISQIQLSRRFSHPSQIRKPILPSSPRWYARKDWLALVAVHSDAWLLVVAFYFGARFGFDKTDSTSPSD